MRDVWVYAPTRGATGEISSALAELGYGPRYAGTGEPLIPATLGDPSIAMPSLVVIVRGSDGDGGLLTRLGDTPELADVGVLLAVSPEQLRSCPGLTAADELLVAPFTLAELAARVARATSDSASEGDGSVVRAGELELNPETYEVAISGRPVCLTYMEYELLRFLMTHPNRAFSREALLRQVWGYDYFGGARTVDVHIRRVRAKLGHGHAELVRTIRSVGYLFELPRVRTAA